MSPFKIILLFIITAALGLLFITQLSVDLLPDKSLPVLTITYSLQDAPPEIIEDQATGPLENALSQISQVKKIYSISGYEQGSIEITFDRNADIAFKKFEVTSIIRQVYKKLNDQLSYPIVEQHSRENKSKNPLLVYRINAKLAPFQIRKTAEDILLSTLSQKQGINQIALRGAQEVQLTIAYDNERLKQFGISSHQIASQLQTSFRTFYPGALLTTGKQRFTIKGGQSPNNLEEIKNLIISTSTGQYFTLNKIARVFLEESKPRQYFRINGLNSVTLTVYADDGINRLQLAKEIRRQVKALEKSLPTGFGIVEDYDDTEFLKTEIDKNLYRSALSFGILIVFLLVSYRNMRHLLILFSGILVSLGLTALAAFLLRIQIHLYTIAGITISLGIIIDNSIVVLDHLRTKSDKKIGRAVLGASFTTIMALMIVFFLPEEERQNLTQFCIIVSVAIACSTITSLFFSPALNKYYFRTSNHSKRPLMHLRSRVRWFVAYTRSIQFITQYRKSFIILCILGFGLPVFLLPPQWEGHNWYNKTIGSSTYQKTIRPYTDKLLGGALRLFVSNVYERNGYRESKRTQLYVQAELPHGNTLDDMNRVMEGMENFLARVEGIEKYITQVSSGQKASITISFTKDSQNSSLPFVLKSRLISRSLDWGGVSWNIYGVGQGFSSNSEDNIPAYRVEMKGYNYDQLELYAEVLGGKLLKNNRIKKVNTNEWLGWDEKKLEQMVLSFDKNHAGSGPGELTEQLYEKSERTSSSTVITFKDEQIPVYIQPDHASLSTYELMETPLILADSQRTKLSSLATIHKEVTANAVHKEDRQYVRAVSFEYFGSHEFGDEFLDTTLEELKKEMLPGYTTKKNSWSWNWDKAKRQYALVLLLTIGIYFITSILFENLKQPFFIVLTIPLSFIGLFLSFSLFDLYFDQGGYAAFILLGGLVVNASIYIVNDLNNTIKGNYNRNVIKAVIGKMRPITLTILSTCFGLLPFMFGGQDEVFWFALAVGTTGGLLFSLLFIFVCLPIFLSDKKVA